MHTDSVPIKLIISCIINSNCLNNVELTRVIIVMSYITYPYLPPPPPPNIVTIFEDKNNNKNIYTQQGNQKCQSRMDNPETKETFNRRHSTTINKYKNTTQKT